MISSISPFSALDLLPWSFPGIALHDFSQAPRPPAPPFFYFALALPGWPQVTELSADRAIRDAVRNAPLLRPLRTSSEHRPRRGRVNYTGTPPPSLTRSVYSPKSPSSLRLLSYLFSSSFLIPSLRSFRSKPSPWCPISSIRSLPITKA